VFLVPIFVGASEKKYRSWNFEIRRGYSC